MPWTPFPCVTSKPPSSTTSSSFLLSSSAHFLFLRCSPEVAAPNGLVFQSTTGQEIYGLSKQLYISCRSLMTAVHCINAELSSVVYISFCPPEDAMHLYTNSSHCSSRSIWCSPWPRQDFICHPYILLRGLSSINGSLSPPDPGDRRERGGEGGNPVLWTNVALLHCATPSSGSQCGSVTMPVLGAVPGAPPTINLYPCWELDFLLQLFDFYVVACFQSMKELLPLTSR